MSFSNIFHLSSTFEDLDLDQNPIQFWQRNRDLFSNLSILASMYLSIPTSSTDIERFFSRFQKFLGDDQYNMAIESIAKRLFILYN